MYQLLYEILYERIHTEIDARSSIVILKNYNIDAIIQQAVPVLYLYTRTKKNETIYLTEVICAIGRAVLQHFGHKQDSALAAKIGAFFLYNLELTQTIHTKKSAGATKHAQYVVEVIKDDDITNLWTHLKTTHIEKLPSTTPYEPYTSSLHDTGTKLVKTNAQSVLMSLTPQSHPIIFEAINRAMSAGWLVNERVFSLTSWALKNKTEAFAEIWEQQNPEAKRTKLREASTIIEIAGRFIGQPFYHLFYYDFRGRMYPATAFFHHQGSDLAKGLLLRADSKPITKEGLDWLFIMLANNWAGKYKDGLKTDKIPLRERIGWGRENEEIFISYAENPKVNTGWMSADSPWQFIAACIELYKFRKWQELHRQYISDGIIGEFDYQTHFEAYVDGSNNGSQHLSALTRDEITAPHVNLLKQEYPGDLYAYAAEFCWKYIEAEVTKLNPARKGQLEQFIDNIIDYKTQINSASGDRKKELYQEYLAYKKKYKKDYDESAIVFWNRITDLKERRKIVKRGIMTLPYGATAYGLGSQILDDAKKHGILLLNYMEHLWGVLMGRLIHETCKAEMKRPMRLLSLFEKAGEDAEARGEFLKWSVPITDFPVIQNYTEGTVKKTWIQYGPPSGLKNKTGYYDNTFQLNICFHEILKNSKGKQKSGASPNCIHSLDAAHLMLTVYRCDFRITTIHDSYGSLLGDMPKLYRIVRETFVELYEHNPLQNLMYQIGGDLSNVEIGNLDIKSILESEYAFS